MKFPEKLAQKIANKKHENALRQLVVYEGMVDFSSNDYLGFSKVKHIYENAHQLLISETRSLNGATGSRLLSGNSLLYDTVEALLGEEHQGTALIFNSGYSANLGFFATVPQRNDVVLYDEYAHASIRDGIKLSSAKAYRFKHNDVQNLDQQLRKYRAHLPPSATIFVVTESVFSMDGDMADLHKIQQLCEQHTAYLVIDEAHAIGVFGKGLVHELGLQNKVFATIITFGKALGAHGAAIVSSEELVQYLINFSRPFIYSTGMSPHTLATIKVAYEYLFTEQKAMQEQKALLHNISLFRSGIKAYGLEAYFIESTSAIQSCVIPGNSAVKAIAKQLQKGGYDVRAILSPTVTSGNERLRFCIHSYNTAAQINDVLRLLSTFV